MAEHIQGLLCAALPQVFCDGCRDCVPAEGSKGQEAPWQGLGQGLNIYHHKEEMIQ